MKNLIVVIITLIPFAFSANFKGIQGQQINEENESLLYNTSLPYAIARQGQRSIDSSALVKGFSESDDVVYSISSKFQILVTKKNGRLVLESWPLTRWEHEPYSPLFYDQYFQLGYDNIVEAFDLNVLSGNNSNNPGCLGQTPLRHGDIETDGPNELVLTTGNDLIVFSPTYERIVFMVRYNQDDWIDAAETENLIVNRLDPGQKAPQFTSQIGNEIVERYQYIGRGYRGYAKVYDGDFDEDGHSDLLVWNKLYRSNYVGEESGFKLVETLYFHYERDLEAQAESDSGITGEYLPQETNEEDIKNWLTKNNLTWSQGYPSLSECPGEEGQLIPEMHDPLLNDPEVLQ